MRLWTPSTPNGPVVLLSKIILIGNIIESSSFKDDDRIFQFSIELNNGNRLILNYKNHKQAHIDREDLIKKMGLL